MKKKLVIGISLLAALVYGEVELRLLGGYGRFSFQELNDVFAKRVSAEAMLGNTNTNVTPLNAGVELGVSLGISIIKNLWLVGRFSGVVLPTGGWEAANGAVPSDYTVRSKEEWSLLPVFYLGGGRYDIEIDKNLYFELGLMGGIVTLTAKQDYLFEDETISLKRTDTFSYEGLSYAVLGEAGLRYYFESKKSMGLGTSRFVLGGLLGYRYAVIPELKEQRSGNILKQKMDLSGLNFSLYFGYVF